MENKKQAILMRFSNGNEDSVKHLLNVHIPVLLPSTIADAAQIPRNHKDFY